MARRILIDARYVDGSPSGIGRYTESVTRRLAARDDIDVTAIVRTAAAADVVAAHDWVVWDVEPNGPRTRHLLRREIDSASYDAYWSPFNILPEGIATRRTFTLHDVMWLIDPSYCTRSRWRRLVTGTFYRSAITRSVALSDAIFTVSHTSRRDIEELFPETRGRVHVTYNAVDPSFRPMEEGEGWEQLSKLLPRDTPYVLCVGQGSPYKNHGRALAAFWSAFAGIPEARFVLIRRFERGPDPVLDEWLARDEVRKRVVRLERVDEPTLRALLARATAFAFPSLYEGFGLPALEAMASGTPVITSNFGAMAEVSGGAAVELDPYDVEQIAAAMRRIHNDSAFADDLRQSGLSRAAEFSWDRTAEVVERVCLGEST